MSEIRTTPLREVHEALGARMIDFAGWDMPVWYDGATAEHHAVRTAAGIFDLSHMAELFVTGPGAAGSMEITTFWWRPRVRLTRSSAGVAPGVMIEVEALLVAPWIENEVMA